MIGLKSFHEPLGNPFGSFPIIKLLGGERKAVIRAVIYAKDLEAGAALIGVS